MASLYVAATEPFVGKSAVCAALMEYFRQDGYRTGYMKPVSVFPTLVEGGAKDEDAQLMRSLFNLSEPMEQLAPVLVTTRVVEGVLLGTRTDFPAQIQEAYQVIKRDKDVVVLEGANTWAEGSLLDLSADQVSHLLEAPIVLVTRHSASFAADIVLGCKHFLGDRLLGVVLNHVPHEQVAYVKANVVPFLEGRGIPVVGVLPNDPRLAAITVRDLGEHLGAQFIDGDQNRLVENLSVGAMGADTALRFFRRKPNKAVITGGDRVDLQIAALETSTSCLVLTGNVRPSATVLARAEEQNVTILLASEDTLGTVQRAESLLDHMRFGGFEQHARFGQLAAEHLDFARLVELLKLAPAKPGAVT